MGRTLVLSGIMVASLGIGWMYGVLGSLFTIAMYTSFALISMYYGVASELCTGKKYVPPDYDQHRNITDVLLKQSVSFLLLCCFAFLNWPFDCLLNSYKC